MFILKVTNKQTAQVEQSDFKTEAECLAHVDFLETIGYAFKDIKQILPNILGEDGSIVEAEKELITPSTHKFSIEEVKEKLASISPRQIRLALLTQGITEEMIESAIHTLSSPQKEQALIAWKYSTEFVREQPAVEMIGLLAGLNSEKLDMLWKIGVEL